MGILHEIDKRKHERDELQRYLDFWNIRTPKRDMKERRLHEVENELRYLTSLEGRESDDRNELVQRHVRH